MIVKQKYTACPLLAFNFKCPAHHFYDLFTNSQSQTSASVTPGRGIMRVGKHIKNIGKVLTGYPDAAIDHLKNHLAVLACQRFFLYIDLHLALMGKLDGVIDQVDDDLTEPDRVADQKPGDLRIN